MLCQAQRSVLHKSFLSRITTEGSPIISAFTQYSSRKKDDKDDDDGKPFSAGVSKPMKQLLTAAPDIEISKLKKLTISQSNPEGQLIDEVLKLTTIAPKKLTFRASKKSKQSSKRDPHSMNTSMISNELVNAALKIAIRAGESKEKVKDDLLDELNDIFPKVTKSKRKQREPGLNMKKKHSFKPQGNLSPLQDKRLADLATEPITDELLDLTVAMDKSFKRPHVRSEGRRISFRNVEDFLQQEPGLGIFAKNVEASVNPLQMWPAFEMAEVRRTSQFEPLNWFDQCIQWTENGKLWKFPIDNEQGMEEEAEVDFTEHIFLDHHIESWCPKEGPIKHFMELVLVGLSKNPYFTVKEKIQKLEWYHQYFMKHRSLLEEINAFGSSQNPIPVDGKLSDAP